jgi:hypothetical protein
LNKIRAKKKRKKSVFAVNYKKNGCKKNNYRATNDKKRSSTKPTSRIYQCVHEQLLEEQRCKRQPVWGVTKECLDTDALRTNSNLKHGPNL